MAGATETTLANAIGTYIMGVAETLDSRATPLRNVMTVGAGAGDSVDWVVNSAGNSSSTTFVAGDSPSAAGYQTYYALTRAKSGFQYRTMYQITGSALDSLKANAYFDGITAEATGALLDHLSYIEDATVTQTEADIDSGGSYCGQTRANANTASYEAAVTPTIAEMNTFWSGMAADPRSVDMNTLALFAPIEFQQSLGDVSAGTTSVEHIAIQGGPVDAGRVVGLAFNKKPFTTISTMTDTTMLASAPANLRVAVWRSLQVEPYAKNDDSITFAITSVEVPYVWNPRFAGKLT